MLFGKDKLAGSAQRRTRHAILQHGSIVLASRFEQQPTARLSIAFETAMAKLPATFVTCLGSVIGEVIEPGTWSDDELSVATTLRAKYSGSEWTRRT